MFAVVSYIFNEPLGIAVPRKRNRIGTLAAIRSSLPVCANGRFSEDFENPGSHRYEDKRVSAARFPALRDSSEDHVVPMTTVSSMEWNRVCGSAMLVRGCGCRMLLRLERRLGPASKRDVTGMRRTPHLMPKRVTQRIGLIDTVVAQRLARRHDRQSQGEAILAEFGR